MRAALKRLYELTGILGGIFMVLLLIFVLYSVGPGVGLWLEQTFGLPNPITYVARSADEFAGYAMLASAFLALASTFGRGEHIRVTLFLQRLQGAPRRLAEIWCLAFGTLLTGYLAWFSVKLCWQSYEINDLSTGLIAIPLWMPQVGMAVGAVVLCIAVLEQLVVVMTGGPLMEEPSGEEAATWNADGRHRRTDRAACRLRAVLPVRHRHLDRHEHDRRLDRRHVDVRPRQAGRRRHGNGRLSDLSSWTLTALPLFIWMGEVLFRTAISEEMFRGLAPWMRRLPGRLVHTNIIGCTIFAAVSGSSAATCATIGKMTVPELRRRGYPDSIAIGSLSGAGTLGLLIPPSLIMIVYGVQAEVSIAKLFAAGVIPGILLAALMMAYVAGWSLLNPTKIPPPDPAMPLREKLRESSSLIPVVCSSCWCWDRSTPASPPPPNRRHSASWAPSPSPRGSGASPCAISGTA